MNDRPRDTARDPNGSRSAPTLMQRFVGFTIDAKVIVLTLTVMLIGAGVLVAPFDWEIGNLPRSPIAVDAIPDIGANQQIVFTKWAGRSPQDIDDQISYPLTTALLGIPGVKTVRSYSYFGFSSIYIIFKDGVEFYWSRTRVLEKLASLPAGTLPADVKPTLGPDATAIGQVFWYTLEGRDRDGNPTGGWDLNELRSIQDWTVRYGLLSADGVAEVASVGGFVSEYQIDVNPEALRSYGVTLDDVFRAVQSSNVDVGARTIEINKVEYVIRGLGLIKSLDDIRDTAIRQSDNIPVRIRDVATVALGPAQRRGALDKGGTEAVGGVVVVRHGGNPLQVIENVKAKIAEISPGLPRKTLPDGRITQVTIVPFYDRSILIKETLATLGTALYDQILMTIIVVILMLVNLRSSMLISTLLPLTVLFVFIAMKVFHVDANIVALSGIAIAIGTIVDIGIVICENIVRHFERAGPGANRRDVIIAATSEVGGAVMTAVATTVVSFLPVFTLGAAEGKLFHPLAFTKTFALLSSGLIALAVLPPLAHLIYRRGEIQEDRSRILAVLLAVVAIVFVFQGWIGSALALVTLAVYLAARDRLSSTWRQRIPTFLHYGIVLVVAVLLSAHWLPLGVGSGAIRNFFFVVVLLGGTLLLMLWFTRSYGRILSWCLAHRWQFLAMPIALVLFGTLTFLGFGRMFGYLPNFMKSTPPAVFLHEQFQGLGKEFMPPLDEGSFLYMPSTMPHASIGEALGVLQAQDKAFAGIPEISSVVGKLGRTDSPLDPAPISMFETIINYKPEYRVDDDGRIMKFKHKSGDYVRDREGNLIPDRRGKPYRNWRDHIQSPRDIWDEITKAGRIPGTTSAPMLQPIAARVVMLQSGMRAPMGVKVKGPDLESIEQTGLQIEQFLKEIPSIAPGTVVADRIVGKPYLEIEIDREAISRYGISVRRVQDTIEVAVGGKRITTTVEGRERYPVRVRYPRELRSTIEEIGSILVAAPNGTQIPLGELATINFVRGPMVIKSEDTFLVGYVVFDKAEGKAEVDVVENAKAYLENRIEVGEFVLPDGVSYSFAGSYENQIRSEKTLSLMIPLVLMIIFLIIYIQFRHVSTTLLVFSGIFVAWAGGFIMLWFYGQDWFLDVSLLGHNLRDVFNIRVYNMSVAVWVGFLALFGIATDDGVIISTYLRQVFARTRPTDITAIRAATLEAGRMRIRPAMMTAGTTLLALLPILTSSGRGADVMIPMAIPAFGGMFLVMVRVLTVPVLYAWLAERRLAR